jgi:hypothetical protein
MAFSWFHSRRSRECWSGQTASSAFSGSTGRSAAGTTFVLTLLGLLALLLVPGGAMSAGTASGTSASLSQCTNGPVGSNGAPPTLQQCAGGGNTAILNGASNANGVKNWVSGNANGSKAHWREGDFIAYRAQVTAPGGSHTLVFHYDTVHSGGHAIDYLGSYDATETTSNTPTQFHANYNTPCADLVFASPSLMSSQDCANPPVPKASVAVPAADLAGGKTCGGAHSLASTPTQAAGSIKLLGATGSAITDLHYVSENVPSGQGTCSTTVSVTFTMGGAGSQNVILAWGGHIASGLDWGLGNSAATISGSPFHMSLDTLDGASTGSQDRALASTAVFFNPTISTVLSASQTNVGGTVNDTATLSNASSTAGGTVTYSVYSDGSCSTLFASAGTKTVTNGNVPNSNSVTFSTSGTYYWQAAYSGDSQNIATISPCTSEVLTVGKASPTIATVLSTGTASVGASVNDTATLSGATANAGGTVTYGVYSNSSCSTLVTGAGTKTVTNGNVPNSDAVSFNSAGTYYWQAVYSGDANNNTATSPCTSEVLTVGKNNPTIATVLSTSSTSIGTPVNDTATLSGATSNAGGTVTYAVYSDSGCSTPVAGAGTKTVSNHLVPNSDPVTFNAAGTYYWQAVYSGDANNNGATSPCTSEVLTVDRNNPTIATLLSNGTAAIGAPVNDTATLSGATADAGGTVTYAVYTDSACTQGAQNAGTKTVTNGKVPDSAPLTFDAAGTYYWQAAYSGDANNNSATSPCTSEQMVIIKNTSGISTGQHLVPNDSATLTGLTGNAHGTVSFNLYAPSDATCSGAPALTQTVNVSGAGTYTTTNTSFVAESVGTWRWQVVYSGDSNNTGATSTCGVENFTITNG